MNILFSAICVDSYKSFPTRSVLQGRKQELLSQWRYDEAVKEAEKAVELNPSGANARATLAFINLFKGDVNQSLKLFEIALRLNPIPPSWFYHNFALALFLDGNYPEAISACEECIVVAPKSFYPYLYKAAAYASLDRDKDADRAVKSLLKIYPSFSIKTASKFTFRKTDDLNSLLDALRKAGLTGDATISISIS